MDRNDVLLQLYSRAPAPSRDYYGLTITGKEVILNVWNVTHGPHVFPKRQKCVLNDFSDHKYLQNDIEKIFGKHVLTYCLDLSRHNPKLQCLPSRVFLYILRYLATNDILHLGQTSKIFFELCNRDSTWKVLFQNRNRRKLSRFEVMQGEEAGWKNALKNNILLQSVKIHKPSMNINSAKLKSDNISVGDYNNKNEMSERHKNPFIIPGGALKTPKPYNVKNSNILNKFAFGKSSTASLNNAKILNEPKTQTQNNKRNLGASKSVNFNILNNNLEQRNTTKEKNVNLIPESSKLLKKVDKMFR